MQNRNLSISGISKITGTLTLLVLSAVMLAGCASATPELESAVAMVPTATTMATSTAVPLVTASATQAPPTPTPGDAVQSSAKDTPAGWVTYNKDDFSVAVPGEWTNLDPKSDNASSLLSATETQVPELGPMLQKYAQQMLANGIVLWVFDISGDTVRDNYTPNLNIIVTQPLLPSDLNEVGKILKEQLTKQYSTLLEGDIAYKIAAFPAGKSVLLTYSFKVSTAAGIEATAMVTQAVFRHGGKMYVLSFATSDGQAEAYQPTIDSILDSFTLPELSK